MLSTDNLSLSYQGNSHKFELLDFTATFKQGQITAIVGPNGSGKSTLVKTLSRVHRPTKGMVVIDGRDLYRDISARRSAQLISVVPQDSHVAFDFTSREIVAMGIAPYRSGWTNFSSESSDEKQLIDEALNKASLTEELSSRPIMSLSGGERQRALIARALVQRADIVVLDEPTAFLDLCHQAALFAHLEELAFVKNKAVVVVLHDLNTAATFAQRIVVLFDGKMVADGAPKEVLTPQLISNVYGVESIVEEDGATGRLQVTVLPPKKTNCSRAGCRVYLVCGGGSGGEILRLLLREGVAVEIGPLNDGDIDTVTAKHLKTPYVRLRAFEKWERIPREELLSLATAFDAVVVALDEISEWNGAILDDIVELAHAGCNTILMRSLVERMASGQPMADRIHSQWKKLLEAVPTVAGGAEEAATLISRINDARIA